MWTVVLADYKPEADPDNQEDCNICNGSGDRLEWVFYDNGERKFKDDQSKQCNGCNGCKGTGRSTKWPTDFKKFEGDISLVANIDWSDDKIPYAIVTLDGKWHEKGTMEWFGISINEDKSWKEVARNLLKQHKDCYAIVVDCHI